MNVSSGDPNLDRFLEIQRNNQRFKEEVHGLTDRCWDICIDKPGSKLSSGNEKCITNCVNRFIDSSNYILGRLSENVASTSSSGDELLPA